MKNEVSFRRTYKTNENPVVRRLRLKQSGPVKIGKIHLKNVLKGLTKDSSRKNKHKMIEEYGSNGVTALNECLMPSIEAISSYSPLTVFSNSTSTLLYQLRRSLLNRDWNYHLELMLTLINSNQINRRSLIYIIRSSLILLMNHENGSDVLLDYIKICLGINDKYKIDAFLKSILIMPERLNLGIKLENLKSKKTDTPVSSSLTSELLNCN